MDNYYSNCPARMGDARFLENYKSATSIDEFIKYSNNIVRNDDYRLFLQLNGETLIESEWANLKRNNSCWNNSCVHKYPLRMDPRFFYQERVDADEQLKYPTLPKNFKCDIYADYRMTQTSLQNYNMSGNSNTNNNTTCNKNCWQNTMN